MELLVVITIVAILGVATMNMPDNSLAMFRDRAMKDIRHTQSLALFDDKHQDRPKTNSLIDINKSRYWFKSFWQIKFLDKNYTIFSDKYPFDNIPQEIETAINPLDRKSFSVQIDGDIKITSNLANWKNSILFDNLGRPFYDVNTTEPHPFKFLIQESFQIKISKDSDSLCFQVEPISGYVHIENCIF